MKRLIVSILLSALLAATAWAEPGQQGNRQNRPGGGDRMVRMQENLGLSDAQMEQIREIREYGGGRDEIEAVLSEEQRAIMQEHRGQMRGQGGPRGNSRRGGNARNRKPGQG